MDTYILDYVLITKIRTAIAPLGGPRGGGAAKTRAQPLWSLTYFTHPTLFPFCMRCLSHPWSREHRGVKTQAASSLIETGEFKIKVLHTHEYTCTAATLLPRTAAWSKGFTARDGRDKIGQICR
jgi:hypothetical protein